MYSKAYEVTLDSARVMADSFVNPFTAKESPFDE